MESSMSEAVMTGFHERTDRHLGRPTMFRQADIGIDVAVIDRSPPMAAVLDRARLAAACDLPVMILGARGSGRTTVATTIHRNSRRRDRPPVLFSALDLPPAVVSAKLLDAEDRSGLPALAANSTVILDVPRSLSAGLQARLLRLVLGRRANGGGGSPRWILVAETDDDVPASHAPAAGVDIAARLASDRRVFVISVPPLHERSEDILPLAEQFLARAGERSGRRFVGFAPEVRRTMIGHPWPGNVRQIERAIDCAAAIATADEIGLDDFRTALALTAPSASPAGPLVSLRENERRHLVRVLGETGWNRSRASRILGIPRMSLYNKMKRFGISPAAVAAR